MESRSGAQIRADLAAGKPVEWVFTPGERRLAITLPAEFGGGTHELELTGGYTFTPTVPAI